MAGELFNAMAGVNMLHIPYRGQSPAMSDLLSGQVQILFAAAPDTADYIKTSQLRALAVTAPSQAGMLSYATWSGSSDCSAVTREIAIVGSSAFALSAVGCVRCCF